MPEETAMKSVALKAKKKKKPSSSPSNSAKVKGMDPRATDGGQIAYQDIVMDEDPIKLRKLVQEVEFKVVTVATPDEVASGTGSTPGTGRDKGQGMYFAPPNKTNLGTFVGMKKVSSTFTNLSDEMITVVGAFPKNWSGDMAKVDTIEGFKLEIPPNKSRTVSAKSEWNFPMYASGQVPFKGSGAEEGDVLDMPLRAMVLRYYVHASDAWSERYKATLLKEGSAGQSNTVVSAYKDVTAYKRCDTIEYYTINGVVDDEASTKLIGLFTFTNFDDIGNINGDNPQPAFPSKGRIRGRAGKNSKTMVHFGNQGNLNSDEAEIIHVSFDIRPAEKKGLGVYPVDYHDSEYGWGAYLYLCQWSLEDVQENRAPEPWLNTYTTPDMSRNSRIEWEVPALGSLSLDEVNDDTACVAGRYKYWSDVDAYVLWDHIREKPALVGSGYNSIKGDWKFYVPKMFCGPKSAIIGIDPPAFKKDKAFDDTISWLAVIDVVSTIVEVLYVVGKALYEHYDKETMMERHNDPIGFKKRMEAITASSAKKIGELHAKQIAEHGPPRHGHDGGGHGGNIEPNTPQMHRRERNLRSVGV